MPSVAVPSEQISLGALGNLGGGGSLQTAKPNGVQAVVTPKAPGRYLGALPAAKKWQLLIQTVSATPTNRARTTLGVGEEVDVYLCSPYYNLPPNWSTNVSWTTTAGSVYPLTGGSTRLTAPSNAAPATVTMHYNTVDFSTNFTVVEPTGVHHATTASTTAQYIDPGIAGAWMRLNVTIGPTNVSFYRVKVLEVGEDATNTTGYFLSHPPLSHKVSGADVWHPVDYSNLVNAGAHFDTCSYFGNDSSHLPPPWAPGSFSWNIPARWKVGDAGATNPLTGWHQDFVLGADGTLTITKFQTNVVKRTINNLISPNL